MAVFHLAAVAAGSLVVAALFGALAWRLARRPVQPALATPAAAFVIAWTAFGFIALNDALRVLVGGILRLDPAVYFALADLKIVASAVAIWGLALYVAYLWTGKTRPWTFPLALFAATHGLLFLYLTERREPIDIIVGTWSPRLVFAHTAALPPPLAGLGVAYFFLPPVLLGLLYLLLLFRLKDPTQRYRVSAVALALILFHVTNAVHSHPALSAESAIWPALVILNLGAGWIAYTAYRPPRLLRDRLHVLDLSEASPVQRTVPGGGAGAMGARR